MKTPTTIQAVGGITSGFTRSQASAPAKTSRWNTPGSCLAAVFGLFFILLQGLVTNIMAADVATLNTTFPNLDVQNNFGSVSVILERPDGKVYVGGGYNYAGGSSKSYLALVDPSTGAVDATFNPALNGSVTALELKGDGKLYVGGYFNSIGGVARNRVALLDGAMLS